MNSELNWNLKLIVILHRSFVTNNNAKNPQVFSSCTPPLNRLQVTLNILDIIQYLSVTPNLILTLLEVILIRALTVCACVFWGIPPGAVAEYRRRWPDISYYEVAGDEYCPFCDYTTPLTSCDSVSVRSQREWERNLFAKYNCNIHGGFVDVPR